MRHRPTSAAPEQHKVVQVSLDIGDLLDVMDSEGTWNVAEVLSIPSSTEVEVKYDGWGEEYNEIVLLNSDRVAPYHTYTWSVKCWAKYKNWPWWPAVVTIRAPGTEAGSEYLRREERLFVDFMDRKDLTKRCRCWVERSKITSFTKLYDDRRKRTTGADFESSLAMVLQSTATTKFPSFVEGTLPAQFMDAIADPVKKMKKSQGVASWAEGFCNNRDRHQQVYVYKPRGAVSDPNSSSSSEDEPNAKKKGTSSRSRSAPGKGKGKVHHRQPPDDEAVVDLPSRSKKARVETPSGLLSTRARSGSRSSSSKSKNMLEAFDEAIDDGHEDAIYLPPLDDDGGASDDGPQPKQTRSRRKAMAPSEPKENLRTRRKAAVKDLDNRDEQGPVNNVRKNWLNSLEAVAHQRVANATHFHDLPTEASEDIGMTTTDENSEERDFFLDGLGGTKTVSVNASATTDNFSDGKCEVIAAPSIKSTSLPVDEDDSDDDDPGLDPLDDWDAARSGTFLSVSSGTGAEDASSVVGRPVEEQAGIPCDTVNSDVPAICLLTHTESMSALHRVNRDVALLSASQQAPNMAEGKISQAPLLLESNTTQCATKKKTSEVDVSPMKQESVPDQVAVDDHSSENRVAPETEDLASRRSCMMRVGAQGSSGASTKRRGRTYVWVIPPQMSEPTSSYSPGSVSEESPTQPSASPSSVATSTFNSCENFSMATWFQRSMYNQFFFDEMSKAQP